MNVDTPVEVVTIEPRFTGQNAKVLRKRFPEDLKEQVLTAFKNGVVNEDTGKTISMSKTDFHEHMKFEDTDTVDGLLQLEAVMALPELMQKAKIVESYNDKKNNPNIKQMHRFQAALRIGNKDYSVKLTVKEFKDGTLQLDDENPIKLYHHRLEKELFAGNSETLRLPDVNQPSANSPNSYTIRKLIEDVKDSEGNPFINPDGTVNYKQKGDTSNTLYQLAYHGTPHKFDTFSLDSIGTGEGQQAHGWGLYFAKNKTTAKRYKKGLEKNKDGQLFEVDIPENDVLLDEQKTFAEQNKNVRKLLLDTINTLSPEEKNRFWQEVLGKKLGGSEKTIKVYSALRDIKLLQQSFNIAETKSAGLKNLHKDNLLKHGYTEEQIEEFTNNKELAEKEKSKYDSEIKKLEEQYKEEQQNDERRNQEKIKSAIANPEESLQGALFTGEKLYKAIAYAVTDKQYDYKETSKYLNKHGIKGITYEGGRDGRCFVVFDDKAISVLEKYYQEQRNNTSPRGLIRFNPKTQEAMITVFKDKKDFSTVLHETSHYFLQTLANAYQMENAPAWVKENFETLAKEMGFDPNKPLSTETHERFARLGEAYFREGKAPREELAGAFNMFKGWLTSLYRYVSKLLGKDSLNDEIRSVFDNMLATEEQIERAKRNREKESSIQTLAKKFNLKQEQIDLLQKEKDRADKKASAIILLEKVKGLKDTEDTARQEVKELIANNEFYKAIGHFRMILGIKIIFLCYEQSS